MKTTRTLHLLLIEDNEGDILLTQEALSDIALRNSLTVMRDGEQALDFLQNSKNQLPDIILLDINLPRMDGKEFLSRVKTDPSLRHIPIVVLTTSSSGRDIKDAYTLYANCYITKPVDFDSFVQVIRAIERFWIHIVQLPTNES